MEEAPVGKGGQGVGKRAPETDDGRSTETAESVVQDGTALGNDKKPVPEDDTPTDQPEDVATENQDLEMVAPADDDIIQ